MLIDDPDNTFYEDLYNAREIFDFSKLDSSNELFELYPELIKHNESVSGKWKIETESIDCAVFLGAKNYYYSLFDDKTVIRCRGIPAKSLEDVTFETYRRVLEDHEIVKVPVHTIRSVEHQLYLLLTNKLAFHDLNVCRYFGSATDINESIPFHHHSLSRCKCLEETDYGSS